MDVDCDVIAEADGGGVAEEYEEAEEVNEAGIFAGSKTEVAASVLAVDAAEAEAEADAEVFSPSSCITRSSVLPPLCSFDAYVENEGPPAEKVNAGGDISVV